MICPEQQPDGWVMLEHVGVAKGVWQGAKNDPAGGAMGATSLGGTAMAAMVGQHGEWLPARQQRQWPPGGS